MADSGAEADAMEQALARLEGAVDRLAAALAAAPRPAPSAGVPRAQIAVLAERLDATLAALRAALADQDAVGQDAAETEEG